MSGKLSFKPGSKANLHGRPCTIVAAVDLSRVLVRLEDGQEEVAGTADLKPPTAAKPASIHPEALPEKAMAEAKRRLEIIQPLLGLDGKERSSAVAAVARDTGRSRPTLYRWIKAYEDRRLLSDLAPERPKRRKKRLSPRVEAIIKSAIEDVYLNAQKRTQKAVVATVIARCKAAKVKPPGRDAVRQRILEVDERERVKRRDGAKAARDQFAMVKAAYPDADYPLAVVQIDHTQLDIELVDDDPESRQPIGRPWLTLAIDVYSRMVTGFYLSLDAPSAFSVGMCIRHSALEKAEELSRFGIDVEWPVWGLMRNIHADNGKDFRSETIQRACDQYGISMMWRPVRTPHWGGHIERLLGTLGKEIHALPGTTFSNPQQRGIYKSADKSVMTLDELHEWLLNLIVGVYHGRVHRGIGTTPLAKWKEGVMGDGKRKGIGLPDPVPDRDRFRIDFLPFVERTVQREGIAWDNVFYASPAIRRWVRAKKGGKAIKFQLRRDPRDISRLYFLDPELGQYLEVPYRDISRPSISLWELRAAQAHAKRLGIEKVNEAQIFKAHEHMRRIEEASTKITRKARRQKQRQAAHKKGLALERGSMPAAPVEPVHRDLRLVVDNQAATPTVDDDDVIFEFTDEDLRPQGEDWI